MDNISIIIESEAIYLRSRGWKVVESSEYAGSWLDPDDITKTNPFLYTTHTAVMIQRSRDRVDSLAATEA